MNPECEDYVRGFFLLNYGDRFVCAHCRVQGHLEREVAEYEGMGEIFKEARVEFNYDPLLKKYKGVAIIRDESLWEGLTYTLYSPLIKTDRRALKVAENSLATLQRANRIIQGDVVNPSEFLMSLDIDRTEFKRQLHLFEKEWEESPRCKSGR